MEATELLDGDTLVSDGSAAVLASCVAALRVSGPSLVVHLIGGGVVVFEAADGDAAKAFSAFLDLAWGAGTDDGIDYLRLVLKEDGNDE